MHVPDAEQALAEMAPVLNRAGALSSMKSILRPLVIDADDRVLASKIVNTWCDSFRNGWLGRHIPGLIAELGLKDIQVMPYTLMLTPTLALPLLGKATAEIAVEKAI